MVDLFSFIGLFIFVSHLIVLMDNNVISIQLHATKIACLPIYVFYFHIIKFTKGMIIFSHFCGYSKIYFYKFANLNSITSNYFNMDIKYYVFISIGI